MGFEDRAYYRRDNRGGGGGIFQWLMSGTVPLFRIFGIDVRAHSSLVILSVMMLVLGLGSGFTTMDRIESVTVLFAVILCHEFGHCFGARSVGGTADQIIMSPLGGLAFAMAPRRPWPTIVTVVAGPLVNVLFVLASAVGLYALGIRPAWNPWGFGATSFGTTWQSFALAAGWLNWFFTVNYWLLLFNMMPIFPLDGGQLLQAVLWRPVGYYRSMIIATTIGLVGGVGLTVYGLLHGGTMMAVIGIFCAMNSWSLRGQMVATGPWAFQEEEADYSAAAWRPDAVDRSARGGAKAEERAVERARKRAAEEAAEQVKIDRILEKVHQTGMGSLNWVEKRTLKKATERQRKGRVRG